MENYKQSIELLEELSNAFGPPGYEDEAKNIIKKHLDSIASFEEDKLGSIICKKEGKSKSPKIMLASHMDEVGFIVKSITDDGFINFLPLGGWMEQVLLSQKVFIKTKKGKVAGVIGSIPPHLLESNEHIKVKDMFIDIGATSKKEVLENFGVRYGDPIVPDSNFAQLNNTNRYLGKGFDDRVGCACMVDVVKRFANDSSHPNTIYAVGTVQEEVGIRGAETSVSVVNPDVALILEGPPADDISIPGKKKDYQGALGKGVQIRMYDPTMITNPRLKDFVLDVAEETKIQFQITVREKGGTDGGKIQVYQRGVPSIVLGIPVRYAHSSVGVVDMNDYMSTVNLVVELIKRLDEKVVSSF